MASDTSPQGHTDEKKDAGEGRFQELYQELRRIARRAMAGERSSHTLQPTALVNEAYIRMSRQSGLSDWNRDQFLAIAAKMMRRVLVDHARAVHAEKRGAGATMVALEDTLEELDAGPALPPTLTDALALDRALASLTAINARCARVVELRAFGGLDINEIAKEVGASPATVKRDWLFALNWMRSAVLDA